MTVELTEKVSMLDSNELDIIAKAMAIVSRGSKSTACLSVYKGKMLGLELELVKLTINYVQLYIEIDIYPNFHDYKVCVSFRDLSDSTFKIIKDSDITYEFVRHVVHEMFEVHSKEPMPDMVYDMLDWTRKLE